MYIPASKIVIFLMIFLNGFLSSVHITSSYKYVVQSRKTCDKILRLFLLRQRSDRIKFEKKANLKFEALLTQN